MIVGKQYKHRSSLSSHKKKCNYVISNESNNSCTEITQEIDYKSLLIKAMNQLQEQQEEMKKKDEMMANMIDKIEIQQIIQQII